MHTYLILSFLFFAFFAMIWKTSDLFNTTLKLFMVCMSVFAAYLILRSNLLAVLL